METVYLFFAEGSEEVEALAVVDILRRAGVETRIVSVTGDKMVTGAHGIRVEADMLMEEVDFSKAAMLVLPGGLPGSYNLAGHEGLAEGIMRQYKAGKPLAAICAAPLVYGRMGLLKGLKATCYPGFEENLEGASYTGNLVEEDVLCREYDFRIPYRLADGGETRFHSVANGLVGVPDGETDALVAVHDGVRPFVSREVIAACYESAFRERATIPVVEVVETLRCLKSNETEGDSVTVDRAQYRLVQTPQTFRADVLKAAYRQEYRPFFTDDASVVEAMGVPVSLVPGNRENIKITTPKLFYPIDR